MKVAVVGCGTAGAASALFHARAGHDVVVFERVPDPRPVGAGILLQPTGMKVLQELGLLGPIAAHGARIERLHGVTASGRVVLDLRYADLAPGLHGLGLHRGVLFETLIAALPYAGVDVRTGAAVTGWSADGDGVSVLGERFDRLVIADGARSQLRPRHGRVRPYPWGALWFQVPAADAGDTLGQVYRDTRQMIGFLPTGLGPGGGVPVLSVFWSLRADAVEEWRARGQQAWRDEMRRLAPQVPLHGASEVVFAPYFDASIDPPFEGPVVWLGDSAHAMSPQLGQGANLALYDAWVLSRSGTLAEYAKRRRAHVRFYRWASMGLTPFFQSSWPLLAPARDLFSPLFHRWGWYRRQMLLTLSGVKTGVFGRLPSDEVGL